ncbi:MAG: TolC family protein [Bacillota bacterium]
MRRVLALAAAVIAGVLLIVSVAWAAEPASPGLSLNEAIGRALAKSKTLQKAGLEIDKKYEQRTGASDNLTFTPTLGETYDPRVEQAWYSLLSADLAWRMSKRAQDAAEDRLVLETCQKYWAVLKAQEKAAAAELKVRQAELALRQTRARVQVGLSTAGMSPQLALGSAEAALAGARTGLATAENELDSAYEALNLLLDFAPQYRPVLVDRVQFQPLEVQDLDVHVQRVLEDSPAVWLAAEGVTMAEYYQELMWAAGGQYTPHQVRKIELEQARLDAASARDTARLITRGLYYSIQSLEEAYASVAEKVKTAEEALRVAALAQSVGMATAAEVAEREAALAEARKDLFDLVCQHAYLKMAFQKPWAVSSSSA